MNRARNLLQIGRSLLLSLLLIVVAAHAAAPLGWPLERASGSAFSAATSDVAVTKGAGHAAVKRIAPAASPMLPPVAPQIATVVAVLPAEPAATAALPGQTGPPPAETTFSPLAPRAPPTA